MKRIGTLLFAFLCLPAAWAVNTIPGNADRGAEVFQAKRCIGCHAVNGNGGQSAPDLAKHPGGRFTPTSLAREIWNHGPKMLAAMEKAGAEKSTIGPQEAADLFAYLYRFRHFEEPGDAKQGQQTFDAKGCIACHAQGAGGAPPVMKWESLNNPIQLARAMWNHAAEMKSAMSANMTWPTLSAQEMTDLLAYVRSTPGVPKSETTLQTASAETGETLFQAKRCAGCHVGAQSLEGTGGGRTMVDFAAAMWNHAPEMRTSSDTLRPEEMTRLVGYLWSIQYFDNAGDPAKGLEVVTTKGCIACHGDPQGSTPRFSSFSGKMDGIRFISGAWNHAAGMQEAIAATGGKWPSLSGDDLSNLIAYINSL